MQNLGTEPMSRWSNARFFALSAGAALIILPVLGLLLAFWMAERLPGHMRQATPSFVLQGLVFFLGLFAGGAIWGLALRRRLGYGSKLRVLLSGGLGFAVLSLGAGIGLARLEALLVEDRALPGVALHDLFTLLFTPSAALICGGAVFLLCTAFSSTKTAAANGLICGLAGAAAFLLVNRTLQSFGFVVGGPNAAERATMLVTMMSGFLATALVGGGLFGWRLKLTPAEG